VIVLCDEAAAGGIAELLQRCASRPAEPGVPVLILARDGGRVPLPANYPTFELLRRPVPVSHVVERVESLIDRRRLTNRERLNFGALSLDLANSRAEAGECALRLGRIEVRLLAFFMGVPDKVFSRAQLLRRLWPANVRVEERTVDVHIRRLRSALEELGCAHYIQTVRGSGYRFSRLPD
jgi:two-component system phosphate regulon response regulator PhoB